MTKTESNQGAVLVAPLVDRHYVVRDQTAPPEKEQGGGWAIEVYRNKGWRRRFRTLADIKACLDELAVWEHAEPKEFGKASTATERMERSRAITKELRARELRWVAWATRNPGWTCFLMRPDKPQANFSSLVVLDTDAGRMVYRLTPDEEAAYFTHLEHRPNDRKPAGHRMDILDQLARGPRNDEQEKEQPRSAAVADGASEATSEEEA